MKRCEACGQPITRGSTGDARADHRLCLVCRVSTEAPPIPLSEQERRARRTVNIALRRLAQGKPVKRIQEGG